MDHNRDTLEHQFFDWESWDQIDTFDFTFEKVTLKVQVGEFPAGTKFPVAVLSGSQSLLVFIDEQQERHAYPLLMGVGEKLAAEDHPTECGCGHEH